MHNRNLDKNSIDFHNPPSFLSKAKNNLSEQLKSHQLKNLIYINKKLKFYATFKNCTKPSEFINHVKNPEHKITAPKFTLVAIA